MVTSYSAKGFVPSLVILVSVLAGLALAGVPVNDARAATMDYLYVGKAFDTFSTTSTGTSNGFDAATEFSGDSLRITMTIDCGAAATYLQTQGFTPSGASECRNLPFWTYNNPLGPTNILTGLRVEIGGGSYIGTVGSSYVGFATDDSGMITQWSVQFNAACPFTLNNVICTYLVEDYPGSPTLGDQVSARIFGGSYLGTASVSDAGIWSLPPSIVTIGCSGFLSPFDRPIAIKATSKRAIPVSMTLSDDAGPVTDQDISAPPVITVNYSPSVDAVGDPVPDDELASTGNADTGNAFIYDPDTGEWTFNLGTKAFSSPGYYTVSVVSGDESEYAINPTCSQTFQRLP